MFERHDVVARAPGRVNLIGDHTDYTGGWCLPMAIDRWVEVAVRPEPAGTVVGLYSEAEGSAVEIPIDIDDVASVAPAWGRYIAAVVKRARPQHGYRGAVRSDVPIGAGLASSAALEVAAALALGGDGLEGLALAALCRAAEHEARGVPTGPLDQLASIFGVADHGLLLDCSTNAMTPTPLPPAEEAEFVVLRGETRELATTGYRDRVDQCRRAEAAIGPLRTAGVGDLGGIHDPVVRRRARHVVTENQRVIEFAGAMAAGDLKGAGRIMDASHQSLCHDFESSTPAIDRLCVDLRAVPAVFGARITGGGWGGCVVALARPGALAGRGWRVRAVDGAALMTGRR